MTVEQNLILKAFSEINFVKFVSKNKVYDPDYIFEAIRAAIAKKELIMNADYNYNGVITFSVLYRERHAPEFVDDEDWEELREKYQSHSDEKDRFMVDNDEYFTEKDYGTHWYQEISDANADLKFILDGELWKIVDTAESEKIGRFAYESDDLYDILKKVRDIAYDVYEGDEVEDWDQKAWQKEVEEKAKELEREKRYDPKHDKQQELKFEELMRRLGRSK